MITSSAGTPTRAKTVIERTCRAQVAELWNLWTTKDGFESWWGPEGFQAEVHGIEAREGGALHYDMIADTPEMIEAMKQMGRPLGHEARATFAEFRPCERLTLTHIIDFLPGVKPYESTIVSCEIGTPPNSNRLLKFLHGRDNGMYSQNPQNVAKNSNKLLNSR